MKSHTGFLAIMLGTVAPTLSASIASKPSLNARYDHNYCAVSLFIGLETPDRNQDVSCTVLTEIGENGEGGGSAPLNNHKCTNYNTPATLVSSVGNFDNSSVGIFSLKLIGSTCEKNGHNCVPVLSSYGKDIEMNHGDNCETETGDDYGNWKCKLPCKDAPAPTTCKDIKKQPEYNVNGAPQRVSDISVCSNDATGCTISAAKANAVANSLTTTKDTTVTNTEGTSVTITEGAEFLGEGGTVAEQVSQSYAKAVSNSVGVTESTTITTTTTYSYSQKPGTTGYLTWIPHLTCQNMTATCNGKELDLKSCKQVMLSDGKTPQGSYQLVSTTPGEGKQASTTGGGSKTTNGTNTANPTNTANATNTAGGTKTGAKTKATKTASGAKTTNGTNTINATNTATGAKTGTKTKATKTASGAKTTGSTKTASGTSSGLKTKTKTKTTQTAQTTQKA